MNRQKEEAYAPNLFQTLHNIYSRISVNNDSPVSIRNREAYRVGQTDFSIVYRSCNRCSGNAIPSPHIESVSAWNQHEWLPLICRLFLRFFSLFYLIPTNISPGRVWGWLIRLHWCEPDQRSSVKKCGFEMERVYPHVGQRSINISNVWYNRPVKQDKKQRSAGKRGRIFQRFLFLFDRVRDDTFQMSAVAWTRWMHCFEHSWTCVEWYNDEDNVIQCTVKVYEINYKMITKIPRI